MPAYRSYAKRDSDNAKGTRETPRASSQSVAWFCVASFCYVAMRDHVLHYVVLSFAAAR